MFYKIIKRNFYKFGKTEIFENILPLKSENYFNKLLNDKKQTFYIGIDPTANSLQIGNLFPLLALLRMFKNGHDAIVVVGGATGQIGDPTGRLADRNELSEFDVVSNAESLSSDIERIVNNCRSNMTSPSNLGSFKILNNIQWYKEQNVVTFLSSILKHFRFSDIKSKRSLEGRLNSESTVNMKEFFYPFLQAYDWLHLYREFGCTVQIGGDDQQGNIQLGQILIDKAEKIKVYGLTVPLFVIDGEKVGKSSANSRFNPWLNSKAQSPFSLYCTILHTPNSMILENGLLKRLSMLEEDEVEAIICEHKVNPKGQILQRRLAKEVILVVHGKEVLETVRDTKELFSPSDEGSFKELLFHVNNSSKFLHHVDNVPHVCLDSDSDDISAAHLISLVNSPIHSKTSMIQFNGESITDISLPLFRSSFQKNVLGVLQIGSSHKWIVVRCK